MPSIHVTDLAMRNLRNAVVRRHGKLYGVLAQEIERAIEDRAKALAAEEAH